MKLKIVSFLVMVLSIGFINISNAQTIQPPAANAKPLFITGSMDIRFATRTQQDDGKPRAGVVDTYTLNLNVSNSSVFKGTITQRPFIANTFGANQTGQLSYAIDCDVVNPNNLSQTRNIGKLYGVVPVSEKNVYDFSNGTLRMGVFGMGAAKGFESKASGIAIGKPPANSGGFFEKVKKESIRLVSGKGVAITLTKYDRMEFQSHVLIAGPVQIYPEVMVSGVMLYDYDRSAWYFQNVTVIYAVNGIRFQDTLTGNIRWIESPDRKNSGLGEYQFDIRINEPPPSEAAVFAATSDEAAFFNSDTTTPGLSGSMKYKDTMYGDSVSASVVQVNLVGSQLTKQQMMYLTKLLFFTSVVPLNAE